MTDTLVCKDCAKEAKRSEWRFIYNVHGVILEAVCPNCKGYGLVKETHI